MATREEKILYRDKLLSEGKIEEARSVESFNPSEANGKVATFKKTLRKLCPGGVKHRSIDAKNISTHKIIPVAGGG